MFSTVPLRRDDAGVSASQIADSISSPWLVICGGLKTSVLIGFEATGNYHRPLASFLHEHGFELRLIPPPALARTHEAITTRGTRTIAQTPG